MVAAESFANYRLPGGHFVQAAAAGERSGYSSALVQLLAAVDQLYLPAVAVRTYDYSATAPYVHYPEAGGHLLSAHFPFGHSPEALVGVCRSVVAELHSF